MKTAYSYVRLSGTGQISGDGKARQLSKPESICEAQGWTLSKQSFSDLGVSAFRGKNRLKGDLATFIGLARDKRLAKHPVLILEAFDRFSRQDIDESEAALLDLLKTGVDIHIAFSGKTFTKESATSLVDRIEILVSLKSAFEFSSNLSKRVKSAKAKKLDQIASGEIVRHNTVPKYFSWDKESQKYTHNAKTPIIRQIADDYLSGQSLYGIAKELNVGRVESIKTGNHQWSPRTIKCLLRSKSLIGEYLGNPSFFPPISSTSEFDQLQILLNRNGKNRGRKAALSNIFKGILHCECGAKLNVVTQTKDYRTGKVWDKPYRYLRCSTVGAGQRCRHKHLMDLTGFEERFFAFGLLKDPKAIIAQNDTKAESKVARTLSVHKKELDSVTKQIEGTIDLLQSTPIDELKTKLKELESQRQKIKLVMDELNLQVNQTIALPAQYDDLKAIFEIDGDDITIEDAAYKRLIETLQDNELRMQLRVLLPSLISKIIANPTSEQFQIYNLVGKVFYTSGSNYHDLQGFHWI